MFGYSIMFIFVLFDSFQFLEKTAKGQCLKAVYTNSVFHDEF